MASGGKREGAGRKPIGPKTVCVNWRVSESAKRWMKEMAMDQGVNIAVILDQLIKSFEEQAREA